MYSMYEKINRRIGDLRSAATFIARGRMIQACEITTTAELDLGAYRV